MKYEDYRVEDLVFLTREEEHWTEEEKREVLNTFPESCETEQIREALNQVLKAIEDGTIKCNNYNYINKQSAKAYANRHDYLRYGSTKSHWYSTDNHFYVVIDGTYKTLNREWDVKRVIEYLDDVDIRFTNVIRKYREAEERYKKETEEKNYEEINKDRINANRLADAYLDKFKIEIPAKINAEKYRDEDLTRYYVDTKRISGWDFTYHNDYGEILWNGTPITTEDAEKIVEIMKEATRKAELIIDRVSIELRELKEKYNEATQ